MPTRFFRSPTKSTASLRELVTSLKLAGLVVGLSLINTELSAAKLYKWVDNEGNISYQDSPPPKNSQVLKEQTIKTNRSVESGQATVKSSNPVIVYTIENCESCIALIEKFNNWNVRVTERSLKDRAAQTYILSKTDSILAPTLFIGNKLISNTASSNLITELRAAGYELTPVEPKK